MEDKQQLFIRMAISAWKSQNGQVNKLLESISDEQLLNETAPGRNTGIYLLGHLTAVNDNLFTILGFGEKLYPELYDVFVNESDKSGHPFPSTATLKEYWNKVNTKLTEHIDKTSAEEWFSKHNSVSAEDFAKEPHRNKLNVLMNRTSHQSYHLGQMAYLKKK